MRTNTLFLTFLLLATPAQSVAQTSSAGDAQVPLLVDSSSWSNQTPDLPVAHRLMMFLDGNVNDSEIGVDFGYHLTRPWVLNLDYSGLCVDYCKNGDSSAFSLGTSIEYYVTPSWNFSPWFGAGTYYVFTRDSSLPASSNRFWPVFDLGVGWFPPGRVFFGGGDKATIYAGKSYWAPYVRIGAQF